MSLRTSPGTDPPRSGPEEAPEDGSGDSTSPPRTRRAARPRRGDLLAEAIAGVTARPSRLVLTTIGTMLGIAALVGTVALGQTAASQVTDRFDRAAATRVVVEPGTVADRAAAELPWDGPDRLRRLNGVDAAGSLSELDVGEDTVRGSPKGVGEEAQQQLPVYATSGGLFETIGAELATGRFFDVGHSERSDRVVVLGENAAELLGINRVNAQPAVFIGDQAYTVIGIIDEVSARSVLLDSVIMPNGTARVQYDLKSPETLEVRTDLGAAQLIGRQAATAVNPNDPSALSVDTPPVISSVRSGVQNDVNALFLALGGVALLVGGLGIANITLLSVLERTAEIGLRRALGAARRHIAYQFLAESVLVGLLGGLLGTTAGVLLTVGVSAAQEWTPLLDPRLALGAPLLGAAVGLIAGVYPALKAASLEPIRALRGV